MRKILLSIKSSCWGKMDNTSTIFDESKWLSFKKNLKKNVGDSAFNNWLKHLNYVSLEETYNYIFCSNKIFKRLDSK